MLFRSPDYSLVQTAADHAPPHWRSVSGLPCPPVHHKKGIDRNTIILELSKYSEPNLMIATTFCLEPANDAGDLSHVEAAQGFAAIGSEPRLEVLLALVRAGPEGLIVGDIQKRLGYARIDAYPSPPISGGRWPDRANQDRPHDPQPCSLRSDRGTCRLSLRKCCRDGNRSRRMPAAGHRESHDRTCRIPSNS